jgi:hypothetical protein
MTAKPKAPAKAAATSKLPPPVGEKKLPEITKKKRGGARPNTGGERPGAGRPPGAANKITAPVREAAQVYTAEAIETLASVMRDPKAPAVARIGACNAILDRAHGKPTQAIDMAVDVGVLDKASLEDRFVKNMRAAHERQAKLLAERHTLLGNDA